MWGPHVITVYGTEIDIEHMSYVPFDPESFMVFLNLALYQINELMQLKRNSSALAIKLHLSCINPSKKFIRISGVTTICCPVWNIF